MNTKLVHVVIVLLQKHLSHKGSHTFWPMNFHDFSMEMFWSHKKQFLAEEILK